MYPPPSPPPPHSIPPPYAPGPPGAGGHSSFAEPEVSVIEPIPRALDRMKRVLFDPFDFGKWFALGFTAWLAQLGEGGGGSGNFHLPGGGGGPGPGPMRELQRAVEWIQANWTWLALVVVVVLALALGIALLLAWLRCRGKFMFLDNLAWNRSEVRAPWAEFRELGDSFFKINAALMVAGFLLALLALGGLAGTLLPMIESGEFDWKTLLVRVGIVLALLAPLGLATMLFNFFLQQIVMPIMYARRLTVLPAMSEAWVHVRRNLWSVLFFGIMRAVLWGVIGIITILVTLFTCCIAALPYIGTVILLPVYVFMMCYTALFVEQFGPEYRIFRDDEPLAGAFDSMAGYPPGTLPSREYATPTMPPEGAPGGAGASGAPGPYGSPGPYGAPGSPGAYRPAPGAPGFGPPPAPGPIPPAGQPPPPPPPGFPPPGGSASLPGGASAGGAWPPPARPATAFPFSPGAPPPPKDTPPPPGGNVPPPPSA